MISRWRRLFHRFRSDDSGVAAVEFALISIAFITFICGMYFVGLYFFTWNRLQYGTEEASRYAAVHEDATDQELEDIVMESLTMAGADPGNLVIDVATETVSNINFITLSATYQLDLNVPMIPEDVNDLSMTARSRMPVE